ncbi:MAG: LysR family transcriptional regulator, partial [Alphaproteobacteria bacterium]
MSDYRAYVVFAEVVSAGSMSSAARRLGMTPSAVSQLVSGLERQHGVALLHRSTRKLTLTEAGARCLPHCMMLLEAANAAQASLAQARDAPVGELRIAAPLGFGVHIAPALAPVLSAWPALRLSLILEDAMVDLIDARIDIALRVGKLPDSRWIGRKLGEMEAVLCAAPSYLGRHGHPATLTDLAEHHWLTTDRYIEDGQAPNTSSEVDREDPPLPHFILRSIDEDGNTAGTPLPARMTASNQIALRQMCELGMGIAALFYADIRPALESGTLVQVMPQLQFPLDPLTMLTTRRDVEPAKVRIAA